MPVCSLNATRYCESTLVKPLRHVVSARESKIDEGSLYTPRFDADSRLSGFSIPPARVRNRNGQRSRQSERRAQIHLQDIPSRTSEHWAIATLRSVSESAPSIPDLIFGGDHGPERQPTANGRIAPCPAWRGALYKPFENFAGQMNRTKST